MFERMFVKIPKSRILKNLRYFFWPLWQAWLKICRVWTRVFVKLFSWVPVGQGFVPSPKGVYVHLADWVRTVLTDASGGDGVSFMEIRFDAAGGLFSLKEWGEEDVSSKNLSETYAAVIPGGRVWGPMGAVVTPDNMLAGDVSQEGTLCGEEHPIFLRRKLTEPIEIKGQAAVLSVCNCRCYFHWMCQSLPRLYLLKCAGIGIDDVDRFIAPDLSQPFHGQTLEMLGIGPEKILQTRESIHIRVRSLAVSSLPGNSDEAFLWITRFLRESFLKGQARGLAVSPERIYVSRQDASHRRILNEEALVKFLQGFGFVSVTLSALTVKEQIGLFQGARVILGVHGAGMTNLAFCRPGTQVLEFFSPRYAYFCYRGIARAAGLDYRSFFGAGSQAKSTLTHRTFCEDIRVDLNGLYSAMREMKIAGESFNKTGNMLD